MNKQAAGISDLLKNIGVIPQNGRDYSYIDDAAANTLKGGLGGAALLGGAGALFDDEQDPEKKKLNLRNNLLMGAGLGAGGGMLYSGLRNVNHTVPTGYEFTPEKSLVNKIYGMGRGAQSFLGDLGLGAITGGIRGKLQSLKNTKADKIVSELNDPKFKFNNTFLPEKSNVELPMERVLQPNQDTVESAKNFVEKSREGGGAKHPDILRKMLQRFHLNDADMGTLNFKVPGTDADIAAEFAKADSPLHKVYGSNPSAYPAGLTPQDINEKLRNQYLTTARNQIFPGFDNPSVPKIGPSGGNVFSRIWSSLTGNGQENFTQAVKRPDALLNKLNNPSAIDKAMSYVPFSAAGKLSKSPLAAASRAAIPTTAASWAINQMAPHTTDPFFGGEDFKKSLVERGLHDRTELIKKQLQEQAQKAQGK